MSYLPLVHSLYQWYYPPLMQDVVIDLETAPQGYTEHLDDLTDEDAQAQAGKKWRTGQTTK